MYYLKNNLSKKVIEAYDENNNLVGEGFISPFKPSDLFNYPRLNIYIDIKVEDVLDKDVLKDLIFEEIMKRSKNIKTENPNVEVRVYNCCFSDNQENINYYSSKLGFKHDEGMYIIRKIISDEDYKITNPPDIEFVNLELKEDTEILQLIEEQNKVFAHGYTVDDLQELKKTEQWYSIAAKHAGKIVGNIIIVVKEDENHVKYGWVDDLFISKEWRRHGIGKYLVLKAFDQMKDWDIKESRLEVWSANERAISLYKSTGYEFYKETECSIGMFL